MPNAYVLAVSSGDRPLCLVVSTSVEAMKGLWNAENDPASFVLRAIAQDLQAREQGEDPAPAGFAVWLVGEGPPQVVDLRRAVRVVGDDGSTTLDHLDELLERGGSRPGDVIIDWALVHRLLPPLPEPHLESGDELFATQTGGVLPPRLVLGFEELDEW